MIVHSYCYFMHSYSHLGAIDSPGEVGLLQPSQLGVRPAPICLAPNSYQQRAVVGELQAIYPMVVIAHGQGPYYSVQRGVVVSGVEVGNSPQVGHFHAVGYGLVLEEEEVGEGQAELVGGVHGPGVVKQAQDGDHS